MSKISSYYSVIGNKTAARCALAVIMSFAGAMLASLWPVMLGDVYNGISSGQIADVSSGIRALTSFGTVCLLSECLIIARRVYIDIIVASHEAQMRILSIDKSLKMPARFYTDDNSGEKTAKINQGVAGISQLIKIVCGDVVTALLTTVCTMAQVVLNAPGVLMLMMLGYFGLIVTVSLFQIRSQNGVREKIISCKASLDGKICQAIKNILLIRSLHAESYETDRLSPDIRDIENTERRHHLFMGSFDIIKQVLRIISQIAVMAVSLKLVALGRMPPGSVISVCLLFQQLTAPIEAVYRFMDETASSVIKARNLIEIVQTPEDETFSVVSSDEPYTEDEIRLENVLLTDPDSSTVIRRIDEMHLPAGKITVLTGPNGSGKSSLGHCLTGYYPHIGGKITLFGRPQQSLSHRDLTGILYYSLQQPLFFAGTVRENLLYGIERPVSEEELISVLERVRLTGTEHSESSINIDPCTALDTRISELASELSGGMQKRLSLARALLASPKMYIFDEITANLDEASIRYLLPLIEEHARSIGAGIVYITHENIVIERGENFIEFELQQKEDIAMGTAA